MAVNGKPMKKAELYWFECNRRVSKSRSSAVFGRVKRYGVKTKLPGQKGNDDIRKHGRHHSTLEQTG